MKSKKIYIIFIILLSAILLLHIFASLILYNHINLKPEISERDNITIDQQICDSYIYTVSYNKSTNLIYVQFSKKQLFGYDDSITKLRYDQDLFFPLSFFNSTYIYTPVFQKKKMIEKTENPAISLSGYFDWYNKKSLILPTFSNTEIIFKVKENNNFNLKDIHKVIDIMNG